MTQSERGEAHQARARRAPGATVWLHDYSLWLVPGLLRAPRPDLYIVLFHHPLPSSGHLRHSAGGRYRCSGLFPGRVHRSRRTASRAASSVRPQPT
ncbi:trehalose-6-phosphate synthase [Kitasatospora sp. MAA19]|uniref:trehalose-6-phosphate synthase n=1 Tax=Kitasatospora sp. MAA19 TaxID=3035090 RepID=UPI0032AFB129